MAGASRAFYTQPHLRRDTKVISSTVAATLAIFTAEGFAVEKYSQTPRGKAEAKRAKEEGTLLYKHAHEAILRPGVAGGIVGLCTHFTSPLLPHIDLVSSERRHPWSCRVLLIYPLAETRLGQTHRICRIGRSPYSMGWRGVSSPTSPHDSAHSSLP